MERLYGMGQMLQQVYGMARSNTYQIQDRETKSLKAKHVLIIWQQICSQYSSVLQYFKPCPLRVALCSTMGRFGSFWPRVG